MKIVEIAGATAGTFGPLYHGTSAPFDQFEPGHDIGREVTSLNGFAFTTDQRSAYSYAVSAARKTGGKARVIVAHVTMNNPLDITPIMQKLLRRKGNMSFGDAKRTALQQFNPQVHDGFIFRGNGMNPDEFVVFNPQQIAMNPQPVTGER